VKVTKRIDLEALQRELAAAAVPTSGLGKSGTDQDGEVYTYDAGGGIIDLPAEATPVVNAHTAPPRIVEHVETRAVEAVTSTTDGAFHELWRLPTAPKHTYRAMLELRATDRSDGTTKAQQAVLVFKGLASTVTQVGSTTVLWSAQDAAATGWAIQVQTQSTELVFGVRGAAGKTVDWSISGDLVVFSPEGL